MFISRKSSFVVSGSQDTTIKMWTIPTEFVLGDGVPPKSLVPRFLAKAHEKDVNCVAISPNDKLVVTASQDRTAKVIKMREKNEGRKMSEKIEKVFKQEKTVRKVYM